MIIELTGNKGQSIFINRDHIIMFQSAGQYTEVILTGGKTAIVREDVKVLSEQLNK